MIFAHNKAFALIGAYFHAHCPISGGRRYYMVVLAQSGGSPLPGARFRQAKEAIPERQAA
jgi:hypothetical protein